ncbi:hypothetical protein [Marinicella sp. W31]|uniref:hypothetical protein n=1 Tax=Marinicella sp. W31 TaxID=3023713 RepID=UPI0037567001
MKKKLFLLLSLMFSANAFADVKVTCQIGFPGLIGSYTTVSIWPFMGQAQLAADDCVYRQHGIATITVIGDDSDNGGGGIGIGPGGGGPGGGHDE